MTGIDQDEDVVDEHLDAVSRGHHRVWLASFSVGIVLVGLLLFIGARYLLRSSPSAKSVDSALEEFRATSSTVGDAPVSFNRPAPGVYQVTGEGGEKISFPPNSQTDGAVMPVSVQYLAGGCWRWHLDFNTAHWQEFDFCPQGGDLLLGAQRNFQSWDFGTLRVENLGTYTCDPPAPIVVAGATSGQAFDHRCVGDNSAAPGESVTSGPSVFVGIESLDIGGATVTAIHQIREQRISGPQEGEIVEEWWFAAQTGLPLKSQRHYRLDTSSPLGTITYEENGSWQLSSMEPRT